MKGKALKGTSESGPAAAMRRPELLENCRAIAAEFHADGFVMSVRQIYYQFVGRGLYTPGSGKKGKKQAFRFYKRIGSAIAAARLNGTFPLGCDWPWRKVYAGRWYLQPFRPFVFVEKESLAGVLESACRKLQVGLFACKGYPSVSALANWTRKTAGQLQPESEAVIVYLGDHDPDGLQIPRTIVDQVRSLQGVLADEAEANGEDEPFRFRFKLERVALTAAQVAQYDPPPFQAPVEGSRHAGYVEETGGTDCWELDALEPRPLIAIMRAAVEKWHDPAIHEANQDEARSVRADFCEQLPAAVAEVLQ